jgi:hypothetical protein
MVPDAGRWSAGNGSMKAWRGSVGSMAAGPLRCLTIAQSALVFV